MIAVADALAEHERRDAAPVAVVEQFERAVISDALQRHDGEIAVTAKYLQVPKQTLYDKMRRLKVQADVFR